MGLQSPRRVDVIILVGLVFLACASDAASRGHLFKAGAARRSLTDTTNRKVFNVTAFGAKPESGEKGRKMTELPGGGDPTKPQEPVGGKDDGSDDGPNPDGNNDTGMVSFLKTNNSSIAFQNLHDQNSHFMDVTMKR